MNSSIKEKKSTMMRATAISVLIASLFPIAAFASTGSVIEGHVKDSKAHKPLQSVVVKIVETGASVTTNDDGAFSFQDITPGAYTLLIQPVGQPPIESKVTVVDQQTVHQEIDVGNTDDAVQQIKILGQYTQAAQARAAQQSAPNLISIMTSDEMRKLPDVNTGEAVRRLPGVSLETDEGEGRYVNLRGLDSDLNGTTFDGLRLPPTNNASPTGGYRAVTFDSIPSGLVGAITVTKTNMPEQDAEALGGTIEITPKTVPLNGKPFMSGHVGTGYEPLSGTNVNDLSVSAGGRFGFTAPVSTGIDAYSDKPFSVVASATYYEDQRAISDVEPAFIDSPTLPNNALSEIQQRDYQLHRRRHGYGLDFGFQPDANNNYYVRAFDAGHTENYVRNMLDITPDQAATVIGGQITDTLNNPGALAKKLRYEQETISDRVFMVGGKNKFDDGKILDYRVGYTIGEYTKPYDYNSTFTYAGPAGSTGITYSPSGQGSTPIYTITGAAANTYTNPANYTLTGFSNSTASNSDKEKSVASNLSSPVNWGHFEEETLKIGAQLRFREKEQTSPQYTYATIPPISLANASSGSNITYYNNQYQNGPNIIPGYLPSQLGSGTLDPVATAQQYLDAKENVYAAYGQYQLTQGKLGILGGVRIETTRDKFSAFATTPAGDIVPIDKSYDYTNYFPSIQAKYEIAPKLQIRAAFSSTLARPGFNQINPSVFVDVASGLITTGNPDLKPATSNNFDLSIEQYLPSAGILSLGIFDKEITNYIVSSVSNQSFPANGLYPGSLGANLKVYSYANTPSSHVRGLEFNYEQRFNDLQGVLGGLGAGFNWTLVNSSFQIRPGETSMLPSSSKNTGNASVFYDRAGLNLRLGMYYVSEDLFAIGHGPGLDVYNAARTSLDFGSSYKIAKEYAVYFNAKNLLDTPHTFYEGSSDRVIQREFYGKTYQVGINFDL